MILHKRPRVEGARETEILDATVELLVESGYDRLTMDAVATRAKASKATLYRRWESKPSLVIDALERAKRSPHVDGVDTGTLRGDLIEAFCGPSGLTDNDNPALMASLVTALGVDPEFAAEFRNRFLAPKIEATKAIYERAKQRGEITDDVDVDLLSPALAGILLHRTFLLGLPVDSTTVEAVIDQIILPAATRRPANSPTQGS
ncbi:MAG: TetR/AcrR family transcriptional regulator [Nocardioidaceae bacterium]